MRPASPCTFSSPPPPHGPARLLGSHHDLDPSLRSAQQCGPVHAGRRAADSRAARGPAILVAGVSFAIPQYLVSNFHGPWLVDVVAAIVSMGALTLFLKVWHPKQVWLSTSREGESVSAEAAEKQRVATGYTRAQVFKAWMPWVILSVLVFLWGLPQINHIQDPEFNCRRIFEWYYSFEYHCVDERMSYSPGTRCKRSRGSCKIIYGFK